jgi:hypothetical protein
MEICSLPAKTFDEILKNIEDSHKESSGYWDDFFDLDAYKRRKNKSGSPSPLSLTPVAEEEEEEEEEKDLRIDLVPDPLPSDFIIATVPSAITTASLKDFVIARKPIHSLSTSPPSGPVASPPSILQAPPPIHGSSFEFDFSLHSGFITPLLSQVRSSLHMVSKSSKP